MWTSLAFLCLPLSSFGHCQQSSWSDSVKNQSQVTWLLYSKASGSFPLQSKSKAPGMALKPYVIKSALTFLTSASRISHLFTSAPVTWFPCYSLNVTDTLLPPNVAPVIPQFGKWRCTWLTFSSSSGIFSVITSFLRPSLPSSSKITIPTTLLFN